MLGQIEDWKISKSQETRLKKGDSIRRTRQEGGSWVGEAIQDVKAPCGVVFSRISDFEGYSRMVMGCVESSNYDVGEANRVGSQIVKTRLVSQILHIRVDASFVQIVNKRQGTVSFSLDSDKT